MKLKKYTMRSREVHSVKVTKENFEEVAKWAGGFIWRNKATQESLGVIVINESAPLSCRFGRWLVRYEYMGAQGRRVSWGVEGDNFEKDYKEDET